MAKVNIGIETGSWITIAAGIVIAVVSYYQTTDYDAPFYSGVVGGIFLAAIGAYTAWAAATGRARSTLWVSLAIIVVGLWLAAYPWFATVTDTYFYTNVAGGLIAAIVAGYEMWAANRDTTSERRRATF